MISRDGRPSVEAEESRRSEKRRDSELTRRTWPRRRRRLADSLERRDGSSTTISGASKEVVSGRGERGSSSPSEDIEDLEDNEVGEVDSEGGATLEEEAVELAEPLRRRLKKPIERFFLRLRG